MLIWVGLKYPAFGAVVVGVTDFDRNRMQKATWAANFRTALDAEPSAYAMHRGDPVMGHRLLRRREFARIDQ
jgi:hypothetical protein